jgi:hypothetical protein
MPYLGAVTVTRTALPGTPAIVPAGRIVEYESVQP